MNKKQDFKDPGSERALLGTIIKNGKASFLEADELVCANDFSLRINKAVYASMKELFDNPEVETVDIETIKLKMKALGFDDCLDSHKDIEYLELLSEVNFNKNNVTVFAKQIRKYSIFRDLHKRHVEATSYLEQISGNEDLATVIGNAENMIVDFINGDDSEKIAFVAEDIEAYLQNALDSEPIDQVGLPTGFPILDMAIGGGLRRSTVNVTVARSKIGKSFDAMNIALNVAQLGIPVLYLDTELTKNYQMGRMLCMKAQCPIYLYETHKFKGDKALTQKLIQAKNSIAKTPFYYQQIGGMTHIEAMSIARKWISKFVGFNSSGKANDCLVIYDYLKLTGENQISKNIQEWLALGLMMTDLHNFALKYDIPILAYVQSNRQGIESDETNIVAGSDRILWLSSSLTVLRNKEENDIEMGCGWEFGNKKKIVTATRYGSGLEKQGDYINIKASLSPQVSKYQGTGLMTEGLLFSQCVGDHG